MTTSGVDWIRAYLNRPASDMKLGLERLATLLDALGNPERTLRGIHVAGTNGKGSSSAMLYAMLQAAGYRVGMYTSPHLASYAERYRLAVGPGESVEIQEGQFLTYVDRIRAVAGDTPPTWFEILTAVAYLYFADAGADWVVWEVGLGGRLDATNVRGWDYQLITAIDFDHMRELGDTLPRIAAEKAGIFHPSPVRRTTFVTTASGAALQTILDTGAARGHDGWVHDRELRAEHPAQTPDGIRFNYRNRETGTVLEGLEAPLPGIHQCRNASGAVGLIDLMRHGQAIRISDDAIRQGLRRTAWPGRLERIGPPQWPAEAARLILDGAHNPQGVRMLAETLAAWRDGGFLEATGKIHVIAAVKGDKALAEMVEGIGGFADTLRFPVVATDMPMIDPAVLRAAFGRGTTTASVAAALTEAQAGSGPADLIVVCGSLYLVGAARAQLFGQRGWALDAVSDK